MSGPPNNVDPSTAIAFVSPVDASAGTFDVLVATSDGNKIAFPRAAIDTTPTVSPRAVPKTAIKLGNGKGLSYVEVDSDIDFDGTFNCKVHGLMRWRFGRDGTNPETGVSNAYGNFVLKAFDDTGTYIDTPIGIVRAAGGLATISRPTKITTTLQIGASVPAVTGSKASGAAWASLLAIMVTMGLVTDSTTT